MRPKLPNFPDYVLNDWIKELVANKVEFVQLLNELPPRYGPLDKIAWKREQQILDFTLDKFDDFINWVNRENVNWGMTSSASERNLSHISKLVNDFPFFFISLAVAVHSLSSLF